MENHGKSQCLFCGKVVIYYRDLVNLKTHLKVRHDITENLELAVSLLFLTDLELEEFLVRLKSRIEDGTKENLSVKNEMEDVKIKVKNKVS